MQQSILQVIYLKSLIFYSYRFAPSRVRFSFNTFDKQCFHRAFFFSIIHHLVSPPGHASFSTDAFLMPQNVTMAEVARDFSSPILSATWYNGLYSVLIIYIFSIVFGHLYTTVHSFTDCLMGVLSTPRHPWIRSNGLLWVCPSSWEWFETRQI